MLDRNRWLFSALMIFGLVSVAGSCRSGDVDAEIPSEEQTVTAEESSAATSQREAAEQLTEEPISSAPTGAETQRSRKESESLPPPKLAPPVVAPQSPEPPPEPEIVEVVIPEGTIFELELLTPLDTSVNRVGDEIQARTISPIYLKGESVLSQGTYVEGRVTEAQASGKVKGRARLAFTFDRLSTGTGVKVVETSYVDKEAGSGKKKDATIIGGGAGVGALVGGIIGGKKGAAIGAAIGGAGGTAVVLTTKGQEIRLPVGTEVNVRLDAPVTIQLN